MGWLRLRFRDVRTEPTSRAVLADPLTQSRAAHASEQTQAKRFSTTPTRSALRHYVGPREMALVWLPALLSYAPWLHGHYPLLRYYGRSDPGRPFRHHLPWFPDSHHQNFPPFCLQPSAVLGQTRSTPSTLAALFCSGFAVRSLARQNRRPNRVHFVRPFERTLLRTGGSLPVALHPGVSPRCSYFQLLALQCRPSQGLSPCCSSALSGARALASRRRDAGAPAERHRLVATLTSSLSRRFISTLAASNQQGFRGAVRAESSADFLAEGTK